MMKILEDFLKPTQQELFSRLCKMYPNAAAHEGGYILVPGEAPVLLVAHLDTVHEKPVRYICKTSNGNILMSPQGIGGDDRCGVYALVTAHARSEKKPWLLFTCSEEVGGIGARIFCKDHRAGAFPKELDTMKMLVEIDRKGRTDAVYYDCDNPDFEEYINGKGFVTQHGSFSDISCLGPELRVAAVNLSSGYYNAHTQHEYINRKHLNGTVRKVVSIIADAAQPDFPAYSYFERVWSYVGTGKYEGVFFGSGRGSCGYAQKDPDLEDVPEEIRYEYEALLDLYSPDELNAIRAEDGDWAIRSLYDSEVSQLYADIPAPDVLDSDSADIYLKGVKR